jgi:outer membrane receptor protein involved in Fe transport
MKVKFTPLRAFATLLFLFYITLLSAQNATLQGVVTDAATAESLPGVTIKIGAVGAVTDTDGRYSVTIPAGSHVVVVHFVGYETIQRDIRIAAGEKQQLDFTLIDSDNLLQQTTVTAGKFDKPLGEVTVSIEVLKPRLVESVNTTSIDEVLTKVPGMSVIDGQASIRGGAGFSYGAGTRVLLLVDDMPALQADAGYPNWDDFPVENIAQLEVLKGAASALYGSSAMNGVVNIRTGYAKDKPETRVFTFGKIWNSPADESKKWWGTDSSGIGQPFEMGLGFSHAQKSGKWDFVLGGYGLFRDSYNKETYSRYGRITPNIRYRVSDRLTIGLNSNFNFGKSGNFFVWGGDGATAYQAGLGSASKTLGRVRFTIDPSLQYFDAAGNRHKVLTRFYSVKNNNSGNQSNQSQMYYTEYQFQRKMQRVDLVTTAGIVGTFTHVDAELYNKAEYKSRNYAAYLQGDWKPLKKLNLSAGVRYEKNILFSPEKIYLDTVLIGEIIGGKSEEAKPVFRFGANYQLAKGTFLRASWGQGYRYPTIAEKFIYTEFSKGNVVVPNINLFSETGWTAELGLKQGFKIQSWQGYIDLAVFRQEYQDMMEFVLDTAIIKFTSHGIFQQTRFQSQNQGDTKVLGGEIAIAGQGDLGPGQLSILGGYTYIDPRYKVFNKRTENFWGSSDTSTNVLKYRFRHTAKIDAEYNLKKFGFGASLQYNSFMEAIDAVFELDLPYPLTVEPFSGVKRFRAKREDITLLDLRASYRFNKHLKISALAGNVLNQEYMLRPALLEAPRNYTLRVDWTIQ